MRHLACFVESENLEKKLNKLEIAIRNACENEANTKNIDREWLIQVIANFKSPEAHEIHLKSKNITLFEYIEDFIIRASKGRRFNSNGAPLKPSIIKEYRTSFKYLQQFAERYFEPDFANIDMTFYVDYVSFLREHNLNDNTIGKRIKTLKTFLNAATDEGFNTHFKYKNKQFKTLETESENIYLNKPELNRLSNLDLNSTPHLERVRDLFVVACYTGLRFSDLHKIHSDEITDDIVFIKQEKTGNKVEIPIHPIVWDILKKYDGDLPPMISNQKYNKYIKEVGKLAEINSKFKKTIFIDGKPQEKAFPKHDLISSHTARRTFCTNAYKDGASVNAIRKISGHKTETSFLKYIKADEGESARELLRIWDKTN